MKGLRIYKVLYICMEQVDIIDSFLECAVRWFRRTMSEYSDRNDATFL